MKKKSQRLEKFFLSYKPGLAVLWLGIIPILYAQTGDKAMAERYTLWAQNAMAEQRWTDALAALERGADFSNVSSDIDYLLGLVRFHERRPLGAVLEAINRSLETNRWSRYAPAQAKLLRAEALLRLGRYADALSEVSQIPQSIDTICLKLRAFRGLNDREAFANTAAQGMDAYPRDPRPVRLFFEYAADRLPRAGETDLMTLALKRLPLLLQTDRDLAYLAVKFIPDPDEARRIIGAYRAIPRGNPASIPEALNLGLIDGKDAVDELFAPVSDEKRIDKRLLLAVWNLLRDDPQRDQFREYIRTFSGTIIEDADLDGFPETAVRYAKGLIAGYSYDADQDGLPELTVFFEAGVPIKMEQTSSPAAGAMAGYPPVKAEERVKTTLFWEQYPAVLESHCDGATYIPKPFDFFYFPLYFTKLESGDALYPERNPHPPELSRQTLMAQALLIERPSREFPGGIERIALDQGVPQRAWEMLNGRVVSETDYRLGVPRIQRIDLDENGSMETVRTFILQKNSEEPVKIASSQSDWNEDGLYEYEEQFSYTEDSYRVIRFWDVDRDGVREFSDSLWYVQPQDF